VNVSSNPVGADVFADGDFVGNSPTVLKLAPGKRNRGCKVVWLRGMVERNHRAERAGSSADCEFGKTVTVAFHTLPLLKLLETTLTMTASALSRSFRCSLVRGCAHRAQFHQCRFCRGRTGPRILPGTPPSLLRLVRTALPKRTRMSCIATLRHIWNRWR
jgi:hypothetical protein